jgi:hypothetical protein
VIGNHVKVKPFRKSTSEWMTPRRTTKVRRYAL